MVKFFDNMAVKTSKIHDPNTGPRGGQTLLNMRQWMGHAEDEEAVRKENSRGGKSMTLAGKMKNEKNRKGN